MPQNPTLLVLGGSGQLGHALTLLWQNRSDVVFAARTKTSTKHTLTLDLSDKKSTVQLISELKPQLVVNTTAYTAVDKAEDEPQIAQQMNAEIPAMIAEECRKFGAWFLHFSTDYVFDGSGNEPLTETSTNLFPLGAYGKSKLEGEKLIAQTGARFSILRTSWVFSHHGQNFMKTMLKLGANREELKVVADQWGSPTSAHFLANLTDQIASLIANNRTDEMHGIFHASCGGVTNWHAFATEIFRQAKAARCPLAIKSVIPIQAREYPTKALRPYNSRLDCRKLQNALNIPPGKWPHWELELAYELGKFVTAAN